MNTIKVIQVGLGPIGLGITRLLTERSSLQLVGAVDIDPEKLGADLGELAGIEPLGIKVTDDIKALNEQVHANIAIVTTTSSAVNILPQLKDIISAGLGVVTTCEELAYPWHTHQTIASQLDALAKNHRVAVLATGINPGFLMDYLPVVLTAISHRVDTIKINRVQDASQRRLPFQQKIGAGLSLDEFKQRVAAGTLRHMGLKESVYFMAAHLNLTIHQVTETIEPVIAKEDISGANMDIPQGHCLGVLQVARGLQDDQVKIELVFKAALAEPNPVDEIIIEGEPRLQVNFSNGVNGDVATKAITINAIPTVLYAPPGFHTMADIKTVRCC